MNSRKNHQAGLIKTIIIIIIAIAIVSYFGINLKQVFESPQAIQNYSYVWGGVVYVWDHFLQVPAMFIWNVVIVGVIWNGALQPLIHILQSRAATTNQ